MEQGDYLFRFLVEMFQIGPAVARYEWNLCPSVVCVIVIQNLHSGGSEHAISQEYT